MAKKNIDPEIAALRAKVAALKKEKAIAKLNQQKDALAYELNKGEDFDPHAPITNTFGWRIVWVLVWLIPLLIYWFG